MNSITEGPKKKFYNKREEHVKQKTYTKGVVKKLQHNVRQTQK